MNKRAAAMVIAAMASLGAMNIDAAGYSTTKSNIKGLEAEPCDPKTDKSCPQPPATKNLNPSKSKTAGPVKVQGAQRTGDPLPDVDVSLGRKTGGVARVAAPCDPKTNQACKDDPAQRQSKR